MNVQNIYEPFPSIIIDDHYDDEQLDLIWKELDYLTHPSRMKMSDQVHGSAGTSEGEILKNNYVIWLDDFFPDRTYSNILNTVKLDREIPISHGHWTFSCRTVTNYSTQILYYEDGNEYKPHWDESVFTSLTWLYKEPKSFTGGNLVFPEYDVEVELLNNRTLIFPGSIVHHATFVDMEESNFDGFGRYCISQFFLSTAPHKSLLPNLAHFNNREST